MFFVVVAAWLVGVLVSIINGNRHMPGAIFVAGAALTYVHFTVTNLSYMYIAGMALLAIVIWIANKIEMGI